MKLRHNKIKTYRFFPAKKSRLCKGTCYDFKNKRTLMNFLNANAVDTINGTVDLHYKKPGSSFTHRGWFVWYNQYEYHSKKTNKGKIVLKQRLFRGRKIWADYKTDKDSKRYFAFSDKRFNLMIDISINGITPQKAKNLVKLFMKSGYKHKKEVDEYDYHYLESYKSEEPDWSYWCDRCNFLRMRVIIDYFKRINLINEEILKTCRR